MTNGQSDFFAFASGHWQRTAEETRQAMGPDELRVFVNLSNDAIDLRAAVLDCYPREELLHSLVWFDFQAIDQQLFGMHFDFLAGRYTVNVRSTHVLHRRLTCEFSSMGRTRPCDDEARSGSASGGT
jgi:hypothetical protein